jgi:predicted AAA+ superfamily ATPase
MLNITSDLKMARSLFHRQMLPRIREDLTLYPAVAVMGARQVGKTTLSRILAGELGLAYRSLDERAIRQQALEDPEGLIESVAGTGAVFDEVQRAPDLLLALKAVVDREQQTGRYLLTGSNQPRVSRNIADSLVGRVAYRTLRPLTLSEQRDDDSERRWTWFFTLGPEELEEKLYESVTLSDALDWQVVTAAGGMPRALAAPKPNRLQVLEDYLQTFARRDIRDVLEVESVERLEQFLRLAAARTGTELNFSNLASDLGQSVKTVRRWVDALERSYLVTLVPPYSRNSSARAIKRPKLFMLDSALAQAGSGDGVPTGLHFETLVANDLLVWRDEAAGRGLFHWRVASGPEADFVLVQGEKVVPVEVKCADAVGRDDARHLSFFLERHREADMAVLLSSDPEIRWIRERVLATPWWAVL